MSDETTDERVRRLLAHAFAAETGGGACTWSYDPIKGEWTLHNRQARAAVTMDVKQLSNLAHDVDEVEWEHRDSSRKLSRFEGVSSGHPEAVFE